LGAGSGNIINISLPDGFYEIDMFYAGEIYQTDFWAGARPKIWTPERNPHNSDDRKQEWFDAYNWTPQGVPDDCDDVFIPGYKTDHYPKLNYKTPDTSPPANPLFRATNDEIPVCRKIHFFQGGEMAYPHLLDYKWAYVQMNLGLKQTTQAKGNANNLVADADDVIKTNLYQKTSLDRRLKYIATFSDTSLSHREYWHILSSPLQMAVSGDLSFGGYPLTFMMKYFYDSSIAPYNVGKWSEKYTSYAEPLSEQATDGFAYYLYGFGMDIDNYGCYEDGHYTFRDREFMNIDSLTHRTKGAGRSFGLYHTNGILELPFFEDDWELASHRIQTYDSLNSRQSAFYMFDKVASPTLAQLLHPDSVYKRNRMANFAEYRFVNEAYVGNAWQSASFVEHKITDIKKDVDFLAGNPFMSVLDMELFLTDARNTGKIQNHYRIWDPSEKSFITYKLTAPGVFSSTKESEDPFVNARIDPGFVAPLQGFFLTTANTNDLLGEHTIATFDATIISTTRPITHESNLRSAQAEETIIRIKAENKWGVSRIFVGYRGDVSDEFNAGADVRKLFSDPEYGTPEIYAIAGSVPTDIRYIHNKKEEIIVPIGIKIDYPSEIRISITGMDNYSKAERIEFIDAFEGKIYDLTGRSNFTYSYFHIENGVSNGRFSLRVTNSMTALPSLESSDLKVYGNTKGFYVISPASDPVQKVSVFDFQGRLMYESESGAQYYPLNVGNGPFVVKVISKNNTKTEKVF
jgi:hypothetical protein